MAKAPCLFSSLAAAGADPPSACKKASGVEGKPSRADLAIRLMLFWKDVSMFLWSPHVIFVPYMSVELMMASVNVVPRSGGLHVLKRWIGVYTRPFWLC